MAAASNTAELEHALVNADAAGDVEAATALAAEIERLRGTPAEGHPLGAAAQPVSGAIEGAIGTLAMPGTIMEHVVDSSPVIGGPQLILGAARAIRRSLGLEGNTKDQEAKIVEALKSSGITAPESDDAAGRVARRVGRELGGAVLPGGVMLGAAKKAATGVGMLAKVAKSPGKFAAAEAGAAASAGLGAGIAQEIAPESKAAEITGLLVGAVAPTAAAGSVRRLVRGGEGTRQAMEKSVDEFAETGVTPTVGMATRRRFNESIEAGLAILPGSSGRMAVYAEKTARQLYDRVDDVTAGLSPIRSADTAGVAIKQGIKGYVQNFKDTWRKLDAKVTVPPKRPVVVPNTRGVMVEMADPVNAAAFPQLASLAKRLDDISQKGVMAYSDLRTFRSSVGGLIPESYAANLPQGQLKKLYAALTQDLRVHLRGNDPKALAAFERSNKYYASAMKRLDESLAPLTSYDVPERVFLALERSGHAGRTVINAAKRSVGKENWDVVAATIFQRMGKAPAGAQNAATDVFSANTFLTNWNKYGQNRGALESLLQGTSGGAGFVKDMTAVAKVADRIREAGRVFANPSGTARAIANVGLGTTVATSVLTGNLKSAAVILAVATGANMSARAFTNPKFVRFLARSSKVPAERMPGLVTRLGNSLASEPEDVQVEIATFLDRLSDEFSVQDQ